MEMRLRTPVTRGYFFLLGAFFCVNAASVSIRKKYPLEPRVGDDMTVCKVIDVFTLHFQKCTDKIKALLTKTSKFHFVQY